MSNLIARLGYTVTYTDGNGHALHEGPDAVRAPYQAMAASTIDVPDTTSSATAYPVDVGSIGTAVTGLEVVNRTGQDLKCKLNDPASATGTLSSGAVDINLANVAGDRLVVLLVAAHGTPGVLSVKRKSDSQVTVQSWLAGTGIQSSDTSDVVVYNYADGYPFQLPDQAALLVLMPTAPTNGKLTAAGVKTTATQSGAGKVVTRAFGDPV